MLLFFSLFQISNFIIIMKTNVSKKFDRNFVSTCIEKIIEIKCKFNIYFYFKFSFIIVYLCVKTFIIQWLKRSKTNILNIHFDAFIFKLRVELVFERALGKLKVILNNIHFLILFYIYERFY